LYCYGRSPGKGLQGLSSFSETKVPGNERSRERKFQGTNGPENESSIMGTNVPGNE